MIDHGKKRWVWIALVALGALLVAALLLPALPNPKAGAARLQSVNRIASISMTIPSTNAPPTATTKP